MKITVDNMDEASAHTREVMPGQVAFVEGKLNEPFRSVDRAVAPA